MNLFLKRSARMAWMAVMRFGCCLCICGILLGAAAVPRAKAVVTEAAVVGFSPAILALYMKSAGLSLTATSSAAGAAAMTEMIGGYAAATGTTASAVSGSIAAGAAISTSGAIILGVGAVAVLAAITAWAISEYGMQAGDENVAFMPSVGDAVLYNGVKMPSLDAFWNGAAKEAYPYAVIQSMASGSFYDVYFLKTSASVNSNGYLFSSSTMSSYVFARFYPEEGVWSNQKTSSGMQLIMPASDLHWTSHDVYKSDGVLHKAATEPMPVEDWDNPDVSGSLDSEYEAPIEIPETKQMVIDAGAGAGATEDTVYNLVFNQIADGTLDPSYEVEDVDPGTEDPEPEPDPGDDSGSGTEDLPDLESLGLADLGEALTTRFPFSIPWDLYRAVKLLVAPAEAPYFEIDFLQPIAYRLPEGWQGSTTIVFDMADYELIGQVSRWTSTVGFCLALIAGSKRYIWMS